MPITKNQITNVLIEDASIKTNILIVANTYLNISFDKLNKTLSLLNAQVNQNIFPYYQKKKFNHLRIGFFCNHERVENNTHSHIILKVPPQRDVLNVISLMSSYWEELDDRIKSKFKIYYDLNVNDEIKSTDYAIKRFNADNFIVI